MPALRFSIQYKIALCLASLVFVCFCSCAGTGTGNTTGREFTIEANQIKNISTPEAEKVMKMKQARQTAPAVSTESMITMPVDIKRISYDPANSEDSAKALKEIEAMQSAGWTLLDVDFSTSGKPVFVFQRPKILSK